MESLHSRKPKSVTSFFFFFSFFAPFPCDRGGGSGQRPPNDGSDYNTQNHAAYYDHYLLLWSVYHEGQTVVRRSRGTEENTLEQWVRLCLRAWSEIQLGATETLLLVRGGTIWNLLLLHFAAHACKSRRIILSSKAVRAPNGKTINLNLFAEPKKVQWENSYMINYNYKSLARTDACFIFRRFENGGVEGTPGFCHVFSHKYLPFDEDQSCRKA